MSYVLTVIHPPENGAAYGKAVVCPPVGDPSYAAETAVTFLLEAPYHPTIKEAREFAAALVNEPLGAQCCHTQTGLTFRIDPADNAPHPCPCGEGEPDGCGRLVLPTDHAYAYAEDSYCTGCVTWTHDVVACQPENTGHPVEDPS